MDAVAVPARSHYRVRALGVALALCLSVLAPAAPAQAATMTVTTTDDELNADGDCSLREAVEAANTNTAVDTCPAGGAASDTIAVPAGTYGLTLGSGDPYNPADGLVITSDLELVGAGVGITILDGNEMGKIVLVRTGSTVHIRGVTLRRGLGGAITNEGTLTLRSSEVANSRRHQGGGAGIENGGFLHVIDSMVHHNSLAGDVGAGGGIASSGELHIVNSIISHNSVSGDAGGGAGIVSGGNLRVVNSVISDNTVGGRTSGGRRRDVNWWHCRGSRQPDHAEQRRP